MCIGDRRRVGSRAFRWGRGRRPRRGTGDNPATIFICSRTIVVSRPPDVIIRIHIPGRAVPLATTRSITLPVRMVKTAMCQFVGQEVQGTPIRVERVLDTGVGGVNGRTQELVDHPVATESAGQRFHVVVSRARSPGHT